MGLFITIVRENLANRRQSSRISVHSCTIRAAFGVFLTYFSISKYAIAHRSDFGTVSWRFRPNPTNPANIRNCFLPVSYLNRRTSRNGLNFLQFSSNPAVELGHYSMIITPFDAFEILRM